MACTDLRLMFRRRFGPYFITQFLSAFNDNILKNAIIILVAYEQIHFSGITSNTIINICSALFVIPFFIFSGVSGHIAEKYPKDYLITQLKIIEVLVMVVAGLSLYFHWGWMMLFTMFGAGVQAAGLGPIKYSILPQLLPEEELMFANGLVECGTFLAILMGTLLGGYLVALDSSGTLYVASIIVLIGILGWVTSLYVPHVVSLHKDYQVPWNFLKESLLVVKLLRKTPSNFRLVLGISWFWFTGMLFLSQIPNYIRLYLGGSPPVVAMVLTAIMVGIGFGSLLIGYFGNRFNSLLAVPFGGLSVSLFALDLYFCSGSVFPSCNLGISQVMAGAKSIRLLIDFICAGAATGLYVVPLYVTLQKRADRLIHSRIFAANNVLNACFMVLANITAVALLSGLHLSIPAFFAAFGAMNIIYVCYFSYSEPMIWRLLIPLVGKFRSYVY